MFLVFAFKEVRSQRRFCFFCFFLFLTTMRLIILIHVIGAAFITVYLTFFWHQRQRVQAEPQRICKMLSGCRPQLCPGNITLCSGSSRCCGDCLTFPNSSGPTSTKVLFTDEYGHTSATVVGCVIVYLVLYVVLVVLRRAELSGRTWNTRKRGIAVGSLILLQLLVVSCAAVFLVVKIIVLWPDLRSCQTALFALVSWTLCVTLIALDTLTLLVPPCAGLFGRLVTLVGVAGFLWWTLIAVYLEGVAHGRWLIRL